MWPIKLVMSLRIHLVGGSGANLETPKAYFILTAMESMTCTISATAHLPKISTVLSGLSLSKNLLAHVVV